MIKKIIVCDKCGKEIPEDHKTCNGLDFCDECYGHLCDVIQQWIDEPLSLTELAVDDVPVVPQVQEPAKNKRADAEEYVQHKSVCSAQDQEPLDQSQQKYPAKKKKQLDNQKKRPIDWDKACALKKAGWSNSKIADELGCNLGTVNTMIYQRLREYDERKKAEEYAAKRAVIEDL